MNGTAFLREKEAFEQRLTAIIDDEIKRFAELSGLAPSYIEVTLEEEGERGLTANRIESLRINFDL